MTNKQVWRIALQNLEINDTATMDEVKQAYRKVSKRYHPDINKKTDPQNFINIKDSYEFLIKYHKPQPKKYEVELGPRPTIFDKFFRIFDTKYEGKLIVQLPTKKIDRNSELYCMWGSKEFRVFLAEGTKLPYDIVINNIDRNSVYMSIIPEKFYV